MTATVGGQSIALRLPLHQTLGALPVGVTLDLQDETLNGGARRMTLRLHPPGGSLALSDGWALRNGSQTVPDGAFGRNALP